MVDWEDLAQRQVAEVQRSLPEPIQARATEVPVLFVPAGSRKGGARLGLFKDILYLPGLRLSLTKCRESPSFSIPWLRQRITGGACFSARFELRTSTNWDIILAGTKNRSRMLV